MSHVVVVGAGFAGLTAALATRARGHAVTLIDERTTPGGKARRAMAAGARVDLGPTLLSDLRPLRRLFDIAGEELAQHVVLRRLNPGLVVSFPGGKRLTIAGDPGSLPAGLDMLSREARGDWTRVLALGTRARALSERYLERGDVATWMDLAAFLLAPGLAPDALWPFLRHHSLASILGASVRTPELRALLSHFGRFIGLDPHVAPAVTLVIAHQLVADGIWYPLGGVSGLADTLMQLAIKRGVAFEGGERVRLIEVRRGHATSVVTASGRRVDADAIVAATDIAQVATWTGSRSLLTRVRRLSPTLSARVAWWVLEGRMPETPHQGLHFGPGWATGEDPLYLAIPSVTDPELAPPGRFIVYALLHGAVGRAADGVFAEATHARLKALGLWPRARIAASGVAGGTESCYGYQIGPGLLSSFRPSQRISGVRNLVLAGATVFPGPGVTNVIRSGLRAAGIVAAHLEPAVPSDVRS